MSSGSWSKSEDDELLKIIKEVSEELGITRLTLIEGIVTPSSSNKKWTTSRRKSFWTRVAAHMPYRKVKSVMDRGIRLLHPGNKRGPFSKEEVAKLHTYVAEHGRRWKMFGQWLGRHPTAVRDRYQRDMQRGLVEGANGKGITRQNVVNGRWTDADCTKFIKLVVNNNSDPDYANKKIYPRIKIHWNKICETMKRTKESCMSKWQSHLHGKCSGFKNTWSEAETLYVLKTIKDTRAESQDQVPWKTLHSRFYRTIQVVRRHFRKMLKEMRKEDPNKSFADCLDELLSAFSHGENTHAFPRPWMKSTSIHPSRRRLLRPPQRAPSPLPDRQR